MLILIDANVPMYVWGRPHSHRPASRQVLQLAGHHAASFVTDADVLQEMLHRYIAQRLFPSAGEVIADFADLMEGRIEPMLAEDVRRANEMADRYPRLSARDLIHVAIAVRAGATHIVTADSAFDVVSEIERLDPLRVEEWRSAVIEG